MPHTTTAQEHGTAHAARCARCPKVIDWSAKGLSIFDATDDAHVEHLMTMQQDLPTFYAPGRQIKVLTGAKTVRIVGALGSYLITSTEAMNLEQGYSSVPQHRAYGEYVFVIRHAAVLSNPPTSTVCDYVLEIGEPFAYVGLALSGVYSFELGHRAIRLVCHSGSQVVNE